MDFSNFGNEVDGQLATIVNNILTPRMKDEKLKEKTDKFISTSNCDKLELTRVNPENWDTLSVNARACDQLVCRHLVVHRARPSSTSHAFTAALDSTSINPIIRSQFIGKSVAKMQYLALRAMEP